MILVKELSKPMKAHTVGQLKHILEQIPDNAFLDVSENPVEIQLCCDRNNPDFLWIEITPY